MSVTNILYRRLAEYPDDASTGAIGNDFDDRDEWEELPVLLQSGDVSDLIRVAQQRGLSASTLAGSILREFLHSSENIQARVTENVAVCRDTDCRAVEW